ncbi:MAG TPA: RNA 2',3'-cyclic phosphodiesterase [bacterium]|nr:RNA 2',3'-cyclic phosphodiesterase [bacterium]
MARDQVGEAFRTFLAFPLADLFFSEFKNVIERLGKKAEGVKWVIPEQVHITLHFFGEIRSEQLQLIESILTPVAQSCEPIKVGLEGIGFFPNSAKPRVIWIGLFGDVDDLAKLQQEIERSLKSNGFPIEGRPFRAHATIGRIKFMNEKSRDLLNDAQYLESSLRKTDCRIMDHIVLYKSVLTPKGPQYESIKTFALSKKP